MLEYIRILILLFSTVGYFLLFYKKKKIPIELIPIITFSSIGSVLYISGLMNVLKLGVVVILIYGLYNLRYINKNIFRDERLIYSISCFFIVVTAFFIILKNKLLEHYDNFSHWGLVVKNILENNSFPSFKSELIIFQSYSTGSASFIYYICKIIGNSSEGTMMFAQCLLILSCLYTLFIYFNKTNISKIVFIFLGCFYILISNILVIDLLVDTLIACLGIAAIIVIDRLKDDLLRCLIFTTSIFVFLSTVKSNGIYFIIIGWILIFYNIKRYQNILNMYKNFVLISIIPVVLLSYLWKAHVSYVFINGGQTKHAVSLSVYKKNLMEKGYDGVVTIAKNFIGHTLSYKNEFIYIGIIFIIILFIDRLLLKKKVNWLAPISILLIYIFYMFNLFLMYLVSMPADEIINLDSYDRYNLGIITYVIGLILIYYLKQENRRAGYYLLITIILYYPLYLHRDNIKPTLGIVNKSDLRYQMENIKDKNNIPDGKKYFIYLGDKNYSLGYSWFLARYTFLSNNVEVVNKDSKEELYKNLQNYDYIVLLENDNNIQLRLKNIKKDKVIIINV